jgi:hypothetical protein
MKKTPIAALTLLVPENGSQKGQKCEKKKLK